MAKDFDLLIAASSFALKHGIALNDALLPERYLHDTGARLSATLSDRALLHGKRTENLFRSLVLSLGRYQLLKSEDTGVVHGPPGCRAPDFFIVLDDGSTMLVEVKNVRCENPARQRTRMSRAYLDTLRRYCDLVRVPLRLALYWSRWKLWTLIEPNRFNAGDGGISVEMKEAMMHNELSRLGDCSIGTIAPLRLFLEADQKQPWYIEADGNPRFTVKKAKLFSNTVELLEPADRELAVVMMEYGEWPTSAPKTVMDESGLLGVELAAEPEQTTGRGFEMIGSASRMFSRYFSSQTIDGENVVQIDGSPMPQWFKPLAKWDFEKSSLGLRLFYQTSSDKAAS